MRILTVAALVGMVIISFFLARSIWSALAIRERLTQAHLEVERLEQEQKELEVRVREATSEAFIESVARDKLGLGKPGETVVVLPSEEFLKTLAPPLESEDKPLEQPNWKKWLRLFF